jgi:hypothetical protein
VLQRNCERSAIPSANPINSIATLCTSLARPDLPDALQHGDGDAPLLQAGEEAADNTGAIGGDRGMLRW